MMKLSEEASARITAQLTEMKEQLERALLDAPAAPAISAVNPGYAPVNAGTAQPTHEEQADPYEAYLKKMEQDGHTPRYSYQRRSLEEIIGRFGN